MERLVNDELGPTECGYLQHGCSTANTCELVRFGNLVNGWDSEDEALWLALAFRDALRPVRQNSM